MITIQPRTTEETLTMEKEQQANLGNLIQESLARNDHAQARNYALQLHHLETRIAIRKRTDRMLRLLMPVRYAIWLSGGLILGAILMLMSDANPQLNTTLMEDALIPFATGALTIFLAVALNEYLARKFIRRSKKAAHRKVSEILHRLSTAKETAQG